MSQSTSMVCSVEIPVAADAAVPASGFYQIAVVGEWKGHRGQPGGFRLTGDDLRSIEEYFNARYLANSVDLVVDYEHQSLVAKSEGIKAPAAGWIGRLERRADGQQLWAIIHWNDAARELLKKREYRYLSPVYAPNWPDPKSGKVWPFICNSVALTNRPFLTELPAVVNASDTAPGGTSTVAQEEGCMDLLTLLATALAMEPQAVADMLGVKIDASAEDVVKGVASKLKGMMENSAAAEGFTLLCNSLEADPKSKADELKAKVKAMKDASLGVVIIANSLGMDAAASPAQILAKVKELTVGATKDKALVLIENAIAGRKITPANKERFVKLAQANYDEAVELVNAMPEVLAGPSNATGATPEGGDLVARAQSLAREKGMSFSEAYRQVSAAKP